MIANASQVRIPCESPVPSRPVPSHKPPGSSFPSIVTAVETDGKAHRLGGGF